MQPNNNLSPIAFYLNNNIASGLEQQDANKWYANGETYPYVVPNNYLIPFLIFVRASQNIVINSVTLHRVCCGTGVSPIDITSQLETNGLTITNINTDCKAIMYPCNQTANLNLSNGYYYLQIICGTIGDIVLYSDVFKVEGSTYIRENYTKIEWWCEENLNCDGVFIPYTNTSYKNIIYLDADIAKPIYNFTEEGEERNGYFFPTKQISTKAHTMSFYAPEYLCDVMRLIRMSDIVNIVDRYGRTYNAIQFEMNVNWMEQGHYANVECSFITDTIVKKVGKAYGTITPR